MKSILYARLEFDFELKNIVKMTDTENQTERLYDNSKILLTFK